MPLDDRQIMQAVQAGQVELFDRLVQKYRQPLLRVALSKLGDRTWAEDIVQETFLAAFSSRQSYNPEFAFRTWIWTILLNLCRRVWKQRQTRHPPQPLAWSISRAAAADHEPHTSETPLTELLRGEQWELVRERLGRLPEPQADALRLRFFGGLPFVEIAEAMDSSLSAAKQRVKAGLETLAALMQQTGGTDP